MNKTRVFISSTCYDLSQVRRDLESFVADIGFEPVLSDSPSLAIPSGLDTIEVCKWLVHASDVFVLIIGGRYGSTDAASGKSVTNIEYETALATGMPIYAFVDRDVWVQREVFARFRAMVETGDLSEGKLQEALGRKIEDPRVFDFIDQVGQARRDSWLHEFSTADDIVTTLKRSWSLLVKELLTGHRTGRGHRTEPGRPELSLRWLLPGSTKSEVRIVDAASTFDLAVLGEQVQRLRPSPDEIAIAKRCAEKAWPESLRSMSDLESFLKNLDEIERLAQEQPSLLRWRLHLLARGLTPALAVSNSGSCPADEIVVFIQGNGFRTVFAEVGDATSINLSLPERRPANIQRLLEGRAPTRFAFLAEVQAGEASDDSFESDDSRDDSPDAVVESPVRVVHDSAGSVITGENIYYNVGAAHRPEVEFAIEDGALRLDLAGRLKHNLSRRADPEQRLLYPLLDVGEEVDLNYQIHADNLPTPARGVLRIRGSG
jgi:hypothetical protein